MRFKVSGRKMHLTKVSYKKILCHVSVLIFSLYAVNAAFLAFANKRYMPAFWMIMMVIQYLTFPAGMFLVISKQRLLIPKRSFYFITIPLIYMLLLIFHTNGGYKGAWAGTFSVLTLFCLCSVEIQADIFFRFYQIVQLCNLISIIIYVFYILKIDIGFVNVPFYSLETVYYTKLGIFAMQGYRLCGIFNEPGALGTICALLLAAAWKYSKWHEKALLAVTGICSLSLAFFLLSSIFIIMNSLSNLKNPRSYLMLIGFCLCVLFVLNYDFKNEELKYYISKRMNFINGSFINNRTSSEFDVRYSELFTTLKFLTGEGAGTSKGLDTSSYKIYIYEFGIIGFFAMFLTWAVSAVKNACGNKECILLMILFFISAYQRPMVFITILGFVILLGGEAWINRKYEEESAKKSFCAYRKDYEWRHYGVSIN